MREFLDRARDAVEQLGWVDSLAIAVLVVFLIRGFLHGLVWQVAALIGVIGGLLAASTMAPRVAPTLRSWFPDLEEKGSLDMVIAYFSVFVLVVLGAALLGKLLRGLLDQLKLRSYDRFLGGLFGVVKAAAMLVIGVAFLSLFDPVAEVLAQSRTARYSGEAIERSGPFVPTEVKVHLEEAFASLGEVLEEFEDEGEGEGQEEESPVLDGSDGGSEPDVETPPSSLQEELDRLLEDDPDPAHDGGGAE